MATKADNGDKLKLTPQQELAVDLLATGKTITETAEAVEVARQTVSEWLNHNSAFQAGLNYRRQELWRANTNRLRSLIPKALDVLEREIEGKNSLKAAVCILKAAGLEHVGAPRGATTAELVEHEWQQAEIIRTLSSFG